MKKVCLNIRLLQNEQLRKIIEPCDKMRTQVLLEILRQDAQISRGSKDCRRALNILTIYTHYSFQVQSIYLKQRRMNICDNEIEDMDVMLGLQRTISLY